MKNTPTPRQSDAKARLISLGDTLRAWREERRIAAQKRATKAAKARATASRGVDRVPARCRVRTPEPTWVHKHERDAGMFGRRPMLPYVNPARDVKPNARLRAELRSEIVDLTPYLVVPTGTRVLLKREARS